MKKSTTSLSILLVVFLWLFSASTEGITAELPIDVAKRIQQRYNAIQSLRFTFSQDTRGEMTGRPRHGSGRAAFYKGENRQMMRWDYQSPDKQVLLSDGVEFSMYFENLQQIIITPAETLDADLTYSFFTGKGDLERDFHILAADKDIQAASLAGLTAIKLTPKTSQSQVQDIHIWVLPDSLIRRISIRDHFGTLTVLNLSDIEADGLGHYSEQDLDTLFSFVPPEGTEIIYQ